MMVDVHLGTLYTTVWIHYHTNVLDPPPLSAGFGNAWVGYAARRGLQSLPYPRQLRGHVEVPNHFEYVPQQSPAPSLAS